eukprot:1348097-Pyramimonas_sp.AAC.1
MCCSTIAWNGRNKCAYGRCTWSTPGAEMGFALSSRRAWCACGRRRTTASYIHLQLTVTTLCANPKLQMLHTLRFLSAMQVAGPKLNT